MSVGSCKTWNRDKPSDSAPCVGSNAEKWLSCSPVAEPVSGLTAGAVRELEEGVVCRAALELGLSLPSSSPLHFNSAGEETEGDVGEPGTPTLGQQGGGRTGEKGGGSAGRYVVVEWGRVSWQSSFSSFFS